MTCEQKNTGQRRKLYRVAGMARVRRNRLLLGSPGTTAQILRPTMTRLFARNQCPFSVHARSGIPGRLLRNVFRRDANARRTRCVKSFRSSSSIGSSPWAPIALRWRRPWAADRNIPARHQAVFPPASATEPPPTTARAMIARRRGEPLRDFALHHHGQIRQMCPQLHPTLQECGRYVVR